MIEDFLLHIFFVKENLNSFKQNFESKDRFNKFNGISEDILYYDGGNHEKNYSTKV